MKNAIKAIISSEELQDITSEYVEKALDSEITNEILKEVPILKSLVAVKKIYNSYTDKMFLKKTMKVLLELGDVSLQEREELLSDLDDEDCSGTENILMAIDNMATIEKCKVFGRLCKLKAEQKVDVDEFKRLTKLIEDAYLDDLLQVIQFHERGDKEIHEGDYTPIISLGLIYQEPSEQMPIERNHQYKESDPEFKGGEIKFYYSLSDLGKLLHFHFYSLFPHVEKRKTNPLF